MKTHAFLIQCHNNPSQLLRLVERLDSPFSRFYIHIDKKHEKEMMDSVDVNRLKEKGNVLFVNPVKVYWGDFSQVRATLILLNEAYKDKTISIFHLLSGIDYPLKSISEIIQFFEGRNNDYIQWVPEESNKRYFIDRYYFYGNKYIDRNNICKTLWGGVIRLLIILIQRVSAVMVQYFHLQIRRKIPLDYYHGSNWFSITRNAVTYIKEYIDSNNWLLKRFRHTAVSDESFFTMILKSDGYNGNIVNDDLRLKKPDGTLNRNGYILTEKDYGRIKSGKALFGRKFVPGMSDKLMELLDIDLINREK